MLALALQVAIIGGIAARGYTTGVTGRVVVLRIEPVDPRDPFRGDYLTFAYDAESVPRDMFAETPAAGQVVYVPVAREGRYWVPTYGASTSAPSGDTTYPKNWVFLRGVATSGSEVGSSQVQVDYGAGELFIPEGSGSDFPTTGDIAMEARSTSRVGCSRCACS